ncbi:MAG: toll/interleukin-1 receptor domain-containing protein [Hyphomicrobiaceae bacterium]
MSIDAQRSGISLKEVATSAKGLPDTVRLNRRSEPIEAPPAVVAPSARVRATTGSVVPHIFLSYAHEDEKWAGAIMKSLSVLTRSGRANVWSDRYIDTGTRWEEQIYVAIEKANVAILLVSNDFLNSDFILSKELPAIFAEKERRQLALVPIIARPCAFELHEDLAKFQLFNKPETPLSSLGEWEAEAELLRLTRMLAASVG